MEVLSTIRKERGLSQRALAEKAQLSFRGLQKMEVAGHNWRLESMEQVCGALGLPTAGITKTVEDFLNVPVDSLADISMRMRIDGFASWKLHLFNFVDAFRSRYETPLISMPPHPDTDKNLAALCASTTEALCMEASLSTPSWCAGISSLQSPWFVSGIENLKAMALVESPTVYRQRNIFVLENFLERA